MNEHLPKLHAIIFDLDGTLVNTVPDVLAALNRMLKFYTCQQITMAQLSDFLGHGAKAMVERAFASLELSISKTVISKAVEQYLEIYKQYPVVDTTIYPYVVSLLDTYKKRGVRLAICTNKPSIMANLVLERLELKQFFEVISAADQVRYPKPHKEHLVGILRALQIDSSNAVMIGDSEVDYLAAKNAEISFVGVHCNLHNPCPWNVVPDFLALSHWLQENFFIKG